MFHICQDDGRHDRFLCPNGTMFNQNFFICDWWYNVQCSASPDLYFLNKLFRPQLIGLAQNDMAVESTVSEIPRTEVAQVAQDLVPTEVNRGQDQETTQPPAQTTADPLPFEVSGAEETKVNDVAPVETAEMAMEPVNPPMADASSSAMAMAVANSNGQGFASAFASAFAGFPSFSFTSTESSVVTASDVSIPPSTTTTTEPTINVVLPDIRTPVVAEKLQNYGLKMATPSKEWRLKSINGVTYGSQLPVISTSTRISDVRMPVNGQSALNGGQLAVEVSGLSSADAVTGQLDQVNGIQSSALEPVQSLSDDRSASQAEQSTVTEQAESTTAADVMDATPSDASGQPQDGADSSTPSDPQVDNRLAQLTSSTADEGPESATESISQPPVTLSLMADDLHTDATESAAEDVTRAAEAETTTAFSDSTEAFTQQVDDAADIEPVVALFFQIGEPQTTTEASTTEMSVNQSDNDILFN